MWRALAAYGHGIDAFADVHAALLQTATAASTLAHRTAAAATGVTAMIARLHDRTAAALFLYVWSTPAPHTCALTLVLVLRFAASSRRSRTPCPARCRARRLPRASRRKSPTPTLPASWPRSGRWPSSSPRRLPARLTKTRPTTRRTCAVKCPFSRTPSRPLTDLTLCEPPQLNIGAPRPGGGAPLFSSTASCPADPVGERPPRRPGDAALRSAAHARFVGSGLRGPARSSEGV